MKKFLLITVIVCFDQNFSYKVMYKDNDNVTDPVEYVLLNNSHHPCSRKCIKDAVLMICRYKFNIEWYHTLSKACHNCPYNTQDCFREDCIPADGNKRSVVVVNRKMPGTSIEVCVGDEDVIDVTNRMSSDSTTIHWHGQHQNNSPYMDGVPFVTQCPIQPTSTFRYQFKAYNF